MAHVTWMPKDFDLRWKSDFRLIFLPEISPTPAVGRALQEETKIMTSSHDQLVEQLIKCQKLKMLPPPIRVN